MRILSIFLVLAEPSANIVVLGRLMYTTPCAMKDNFPIQIKYSKYTLNFKFDAGTSRGVLKSKSNYFLKIESPVFPGLCGYGEAGPLPGLSEDDVPGFEEQLQKNIVELSGKDFYKEEQGIIDQIKEAINPEFPSLRFAFETALLDLIHGGKRRILPNPFYDQQKPIPINGLIWMGDRDFMLKQIQEKLVAGYNCIKMKIGAIDFEQECELLNFLRRQYSPAQITLRVDANGAFLKEDALEKLKKLKEYGIHSIEQPIRQGAWDEMAKLCRDSPLDIALDEELIGVHSLEKKQQLLKTIRPSYLILKPTLLGGIGVCREWIRLAEKANIGWWMTSALESNIGLNAISQFTSTFQPDMPQGLGTGQLYHNNISSPLTISEGKLWYDRNKNWGEIKKWDWK